MFIYNINKPKFLSGQKLILVMSKMAAAPHFAIGFTKDCSRAAYNLLTIITFRFFFST